MSLADLGETVLGIATPDRPILVGRALDAIIQFPERYRVDGGYICDGYTFNGNELDPYLARIERDGVFQAKMVKAYGQHEVVSKADHLFGTTLSEFKGTQSSFNIGRYLDAYQWRFMCHAFCPQRIDYHVFKLNDHGNTVIEIKGCERFSVYPYVGLEADCESLVRRFVDVAESQGWAEELNRRQVMTHSQQET